MKKKLILVVATAFIFTMIAGCGGSDNTIATVAGEKIAQTEYKFLLANVKNNMEKQQGLADDAAKQNFWKTSKVEGKSVTDIAKEQALEMAKTLKIHLLKAKQSNIGMDAKDLSDVKATVDSITKGIDDYIAQSQDKSLTKEKLFLQEYGVNQKQFEEIYKEFILQSKVVQAEQKKINVTDEEIKKLYEENKDKYDKVTVQHVLFTTVEVDQATQTQKPLPQDKQDEAKKKADDILAKVKAGEDIGALAKQFSEDPGSKEKGGEYTFGKGEMVPEFENWAFAAKPGDADIVKTSYGYHVMKLNKAANFEGVKEKVKADLIGSKYNDQVEAWKKDPQYNVTTTKLYDSIKVVE